MKYFYSALLLFLYHRSYPQACSCLDDYYFIKTHIEKNHGGFNKKIKSPEEPAYKAFTAKLEEEIKKDKDGAYCIVSLKKYILYLQDHHTNITAGGGIVINENDSAAVNAFYKSPAYLNTEIIPLGSNGLPEKWGSEKINGPEGIYYTPDSTYIVALIKSRTGRRDYAAVILSSKTKLWSPGQVKFELKQVNDSLFDALISYRNHSINYEQVTYKRGIPDLNGWIKKGSAKAVPDTDNSPVSFRVLDSATTLLSIRSFDAGLTKMLDSVYRSVMPQIKKYPRLIIDVRNNSGGSDMSYKALMPLLYTEPFESDVVEYFVTPGNIEAYEKYDAELLKRSPGSSPPFKQAIALMKKAAPYSFTGRGNGKPFKIQYSINKGYPSKIAVLYNKNCASSCESFLFEILNSSKTIRVGENSGGYTGYGNVMNIRTPCGNTLSWTTTVYRNQWKYEFAGIPPQYRIPDDETDWIGYTRKLLEK